MVAYLRGAELSLPLQTGNVIFIMIMVNFIFIIIITIIIIIIIIIFILMLIISNTQVESSP